MNLSMEARKQLSQINPRGGDEMEFQGPNGKKYNVVRWNTPKGNVFQDKESGQLFDAQAATQSGFKAYESGKAPKLKATPEEIATNRGELHSTIDLSVPAGKRSEQMKKLVDVRISQGDIAGAATLTKSLLDNYRSDQEQAARLSMVAQNRADSQEAKVYKMASDVDEAVKKSKENDNYINAKSIVTGIVNDYSSRLPELTGFEDINLLKAAARLSDPKTGVKDAEFNTLAAAFGWGQRAQILDKTMLHGDKLSVEGRKKVINYLRMQESAFKQIVKERYEDKLNLVKESPYMKDYYAPLKAIMDVRYGSSTPPSSARSGSGLPPAPKVVTPSADTLNKLRIGK
jgi:hypothetical protein